MCLVFKKSACPFGQVQTKMYLLESPFLKNSLAGASGQVLMLVPDDGNSKLWIYGINVLGSNN